MLDLDWAMSPPDMTERNDGYIDFRIAVPTAYQDVFSHFYFAQNNSGKTITKTLLPSYQTILIFSFGANPSLQSSHKSRIEVHKLLLIGPIKQAFDYALPDGAELFIINFKDDAYFRFFGSPVIFEHVPIQPGELLDEDCFRVLWHELKQLDTAQDRAELVLKFCDPYLQYRNKVAGQLASFNQQHLNPVKAVADQNNQSERNIQLHHKKHFGYSAKELSRYKRFLMAVEMIQQLAANNSKIDWFEIIEACGYYDQSQLIHDFKNYVNLSPSKYLKFQQDICNPIS